MGLSVRFTSPAFCIASGCGLSSPRMTIASAQLQAGIELCGLTDAIELLTLPLADSPTYAEEFVAKSGGANSSDSD